MEAGKIADVLSDPDLDAQLQALCSAFGRPDIYQRAKEDYGS